MLRVDTCLTAMNELKIRSNSCLMNREGYVDNFVQREGTYLPDRSLIYRAASSESEKVPNPKKA